MGVGSKDGSDGTEGSEGKEGGNDRMATPEIEANIKHVEQIEARCESPIYKPQVAPMEIFAF